MLCHVGDINQVFLNLIVNAAHAIADAAQGTDGRGTIRVRTRVEGDARRRSRSPTPAAASPRRIADRIFDPFFTTKDVGRGTGQGLSIARTIVDRHGGWLTFKTEPGHGTTFAIHLPLTPADIAVAA